MSILSSVVAVTLCCFLIACVLLIVQFNPVRVRRVRRAADLYKNYIDVANRAVDVIEAMHGMLLSEVIEWNEWADMDDMVHSMITELNNIEDDAKCIDNDTSDLLSDLNAVRSSLVYTWNRMEALVDEEVIFVETYK